MKKCLLLVSCFFATLNAAPKTVLIIRHAEKTAKKEPVHFEKWNFKSSKPLSVRGWQRAYALAPYFSMQSEIINAYGSIDALFAPMPDAVYESVRPIQTITPLSQKLSMKINCKYGLDQMSEMVDFIMHKKKFNKKVVLIAYEHHHIPALLKAFKVNDGLSAWPNDVFDWVVALDFDIKSGECLKCSIVPQQLLYEDSAKVVPAVT